MDDHGLQASIWASSTGSRPVNYANQFDDWTCSTCGFSNFQFRTVCLRCSGSRTASPRMNGSEQNILYGSSLKISNNPTHVDCEDRQRYEHNDISGKENVPTQDQSTSAALPSTISTKAVSSTHNFVIQDRTAAERGLGDSLWAPRSATRSDRIGRDQVWVTKVSQEQPTHHKTGTMDLGLPYEVQHFILAMMQRILEEACFDFAHRWIPEKLINNDWRCAEAVELSMWRDFLPTAATLPANATAFVSGYSLPQGLKDTVRIRNSAVHRHLCDNHELRKMAGKAQDLMIMFSDTARREKFCRLIEELSAWDVNSKNDMQLAKVQLESALREINEKPVNDMDWTPNAVALQEIVTLHDGSDAVTSHNFIDINDAMEID